MAFKVLGLCTLPETKAILPFAATIDFNLADTSLSKADQSVCSEPFDNGLAKRSLSYKDKIDA